MSGTSMVAAISSLAVVLGLVTSLAYLLRRFRPGVRRSTGIGQIEVLSRAGLGPRQGVATIRVGEKLAVVSYGEGGVRHLMDLDGQGDASVSDQDPEAESEQGSAARAALGSGARPFAQALLQARKKVSGLRAMTLGVALALSLGGPTVLAAQVQPAPGTPATEVADDSAEGSTNAVAARTGSPQVSLLLSGTDPDDGLQLSGPVGTVLFIGFMTLLPTLLLLMTGFTRILIVLHLLKQALGTQTAPPAHLLAAMALLLTGFVMAPTFERVNEVAIEPWTQGEMDELQMLKAAAVPMREFMLSSTRDQDLAAFVDMRGGPRPQSIDDVPLVVVTSAFVTSELTSAFQMGFALFLPFVVIDVVVASVLMSMGMFMLPPVMVSLPFKLLLFVLVDGWSLVMGSLVQSF